MLILIVGGVVLLAAMAIGGFVLLSGGDDDASDSELAGRDGGSPTTEAIDSEDDGDEGDEGDEGDDGATVTTETDRPDDDTTETTVGGGDDLRVEYIGAFASQFEEDDDFLPDERICFAGAVVDAWGVETLERTVSPEEIRARPDDDPEDFGLVMDRDWATDVWDTVDDCMDYREMLRRTFAAISPDPAQAGCIMDNLSDADLEEGFIAAFGDDDETVFEDAFVDAAEGC